MSARAASDASSGITLSVAVSAHAAGRLLRPTLRSVAASMNVLIERGVPCELLIVLDDATDETIREATSWQSKGRLGAPVRLVRATRSGAGASRNAAANGAKGRYVAVCDEVDLVSKNYFSSALAFLSDSTAPVVVHPETVVSFGGRTETWRVPPSEAVTHLDLIRDNPWPSASVALRSTYVEHPFEALAAGSGFGPADWLWNIHTVIAGIPHRPVPGTTLFDRVLESGGPGSDPVELILPPFDLASLTAALPLVGAPVSAAARPRFRIRNFVRRAATRAYRRARPIAGAAVARMRPRTRAWFYPRADRLRRRAEGMVRGLSRPTAVSAEVVAMLVETALIEPALSWTADRFGELPQRTAERDEYAETLVALVDQLRDRAGALIMVPWVGIGGADLVSINYAKALDANPKYHGRVSMLATYLPSRTRRDQVPEGITLVQVPHEFRRLTLRLQRRLMAQALILVRPSVIVSVNCFDLTNALHSYHRPLTAASRIFLTLFAFDRIGAGYPVNPITDDPERRFLDDVSAILTDNTVTAGTVTEMLGLEESKVRVQYQPAMDPSPAPPVGSRALDDRTFTAANPFKVVWPHRLDQEKRPDALVAIAQRVRAEGLAVEIDVYGQQVLSDGGKALMKSLVAAGVNYRGPYSGGLAALPTHDYHALLLTSQSEGLPLVLVQSMLLGLPVVASAVGGVTDIVRHKKTGLLAAGPDDVDGFVEAIRYLMDSLEDRRRIIHGAYDLAVAQHGWEAFTRLVDESVA
jgi:glycosyltransferase involved in cell wall biosynthesis